MNDPNTTSTITELVWRRLIDPFPFLGYELPPELWVVLLGVVLLAGFFYIGWMYFKDSQGVGAGWATLLGLLRASVYLLLGMVFMLPGRQTVESQTTRSKVLMVLDASESMVVTRDDPPRDGVAFENLPTRQDKVRKFLMDDKINFFGRLVEKNPITARRFGKSDDDDFLHLEKGRNFTRAEYEVFQRKLKDPTSEEATPDGKLFPPEHWARWLAPLVLDPAKPPAAPEEWSDADKARFKALLDANEALNKKGLFKGTNVSDSVQSALMKDAANMIQGIIVFTDGRSTEGSDLVYEELARRAEAAHIPIFVVGIGEDRPHVRIEIVDTRGPAMVQPEDKFRLQGETTGEGLPEQDIEATMEVVNRREGANGKEELFEITVIEAPDKVNPNKKRTEIPLGTSIVLQPEKKAHFDSGSPPRVQCEYVVDAYALAKAAKGIDLAVGDYGKVKWEIGETKDSVLRFRQHVPKDRLEVFPGKEHVGDPLDVRVIKRPVRVLLLASGPSHDYQFLNTLLIREVTDKKAEQTIYLQLPPGKVAGDRRPYVVQGVPPERLLDHFPNRLDEPNDDPKEKLYDLTEYDVIVAFDPDWSQLSDVELKKLQAWVDKGGGLVVLGGAINTVQLAKPGANKDKIKPVLDLYPVILKDVRIDELDRTTERPWPLSFEGATPEMEFLKLDENPDRRFLSDWDEFFFDKVIGPGEPRPKPDEAVHGFFSYYPAESVKVGSQVVARFMDPRSKMKDGTQMPYIVLSDPNSGRRVVWIANGELYRLRQKSESFHERFWSKLLRYAGAKNQGKISKRIGLNMSNKYKANQFVQIDARIDGPGGEPLGKAKKVHVSLKLPAGVPDKEIPTEYEMTPRPGNDPLDAGKFQLRFQVKSPGDYGLELKVADTGDTESRKFSVVESNPELDNTRPDFDRMYHLASEADAVIARMAPAEGAELKKKLQRPKLAQAAPGKEPKEEKTRLYFDLNNASLIPNCMVTDVKEKQTHGQIDDVWDKEIGLPYLSAATGQWRWNWLTLFRLSWGFLYVGVGLISIEWLIRKLIRLA